MGQFGRHATYKAPPPSLEDVDVSELMLDDDEFSSTFGSITTQLSDIDRALKEPDDPWSSRRRFD